MSTTYAALSLVARKPQLGTLVGSCAAAPALDAEPSRELMSLTGTSVFSTSPPVASEPSEAQEPRGTRPVRRSRRAWSKRAWMATGGLAAAVLLGGGLALRWSPASPPRAAPTPAPTAPTTPAPTAHALDPPTLAPPSGEITTPDRSAERPPAKLVTVHRRAAARHVSAAPSTEMGYLTIDIEPWGVVYVDGRRFADSPPVYRAPIGVGTHRVKVYSTERKAFSPERRVEVRAGETRVVGFEW